MKSIKEKKPFYSMEKFSPSLDQSMIQSSKIESQVLESLGSGPVVVGLSLKDLVSKVGMSRAIKSYFVRYRYILNLWIVREIYLWRALNLRFKDIPPYTKEYRFLTFVNKHSFCKTLVLKIEKKCLKRLICSHSKPSLTVSDSNNNQSSNSNNNVKKTTR